MITIGRKRKSSTYELHLDSLEFVYKPNFEKEWSEVLASVIYQRIKGQLNEGGDM